MLFNSDLLNILSLSLLASVLGLTGGTLFLVVKKWSASLTKYSTPFAAGVMMTVAFLGLLPEASEILGHQAFNIVLATFFVTYIFENFIFDLHHHDHDDHKHSHSHEEQSVPLVIIGDTIHNFIDGVAIASAYLINPGLGFVTAVSTLLHELPHEIGDFGILLKAGFSKKKVFLVNLFSSLSTVLGSLVVYFFVTGTQLPGILMSIAAGMFIYLGASDFLPRANKEIEKTKAVLVLLLGAALMYLTLSLVPHAH
jgi:zinc and cadmium transporter